MAARDREAALAEYAAKFAACENDEALIEQLGTPTKVAIGLALDYTPAAPAAVPPQPEAPEAPPAETPPLPPETISPAAEKPEPLPPAAPDKPAKAKKAPIAPGGLILFLVLLLLIGLPVTVVLLSLGLPFLAGGAGLISLAVPVALRALTALKLIADLLLVLGGGLAVSAVGLLLAAFGLWLSVFLAWLWLGKIVIPLGRRLCRKKEVPQS